MSKTTQFPCPSCGYAYTKAVNSNRSRAGETRRQRKCEQLTCGANFITYEVLAKDYNMLQSVRRFMKEQCDHSKIETDPIIR